MASRSYPLCPLCWQAIRQVAGQRRPAVVIRDIPSPPAPANNGRPRMSGAPARPAGAGRTAPAEPTGRMALSAR